MKKYWLMKSEPQCFSITDLKNCPHQTTAWDGVRNYQARNFIRDGMSVGDEVFFYHSKTKVPGIVGTMRVVTGAYPDDTAFDADSEHPDPRSTADNPRWFVVDVKYQRSFKDIIRLDSLKTYPELAGLELLKRGSRLSVMPVSDEHWAFIHHLAGIS